MFEPESCGDAFVRHEVRQAGGGSDRAEADADGEEREGFDNYARAFDIACLEADDRAVAYGLAGVDRGAFLVGKAGVADAGDAWKSCEKLGNVLGVFLLAFEADGHGLQATQEKIGLEGWERGAFGVVVELEGFSEGFVADSESACGYVAVAIEVFGGGVDDDVGAEIEWAKVERSEAGVVDAEECADSVGGVRECGDIADGLKRVAQWFGMNEFGARGCEAVDGGNIAEVGVVDDDAAFGPDIGEEAVSAAVDVGRDDGLVAWCEKGSDCIDGGDAAGVCEGFDLGMSGLVGWRCAGLCSAGLCGAGLCGAGWGGAFKKCKPCFECVAGWVCAARVVVGAKLSGGALMEGRAEVDGCGGGIGVRFVGGAIMDKQEGFDVHRVCSLSHLAGGRRKGWRRKGWRRKGGRRKGS